MNKETEKVSASKFIIDEVQKQASKEIQALKIARSKVAELKSKQKECFQRIEHLKEDFRNVFSTSTDVEAAIKRRNDIQAEISENEEILAAIEEHLLPPAEASEREAASKVSGIFMSVVSTMNKEKQSELNSLFDEAHSIIDGFGHDVLEALLAIFGSDWYNFISSNTKYTLQQFNLSKSPQDVSQNFAFGMLANLRR